MEIACPHLSETKDADWLLRIRNVLASECRRIRKSGLTHDNKISLVATMLCLDLLLVHLGPLENPCFRIVRLAECETAIHHIASVPKDILRPKEPRPREYQMPRQSASAEERDPSGVHERR